MKAYSLHDLKAIGIGNLHLLQWTVTKGVYNYYTWRSGGKLYSTSSSSPVHSSYWAFAKTTSITVLLRITNAAPEDTDTAPEDL